MNVFERNRKFEKNVVATCKWYEIRIYFKAEYVVIQTI